VPKSRSSRQRSPGGELTRPGASRPSGRTAVGCRSLDARRLAAGLSLTITVILGAGCSASAPPRPLTTTATPSASPAPRPTADAAQEVRAATVAYEQAYLAAVADPKNSAKSQTLLGMYTDNSPERAGMAHFLQTFTTNGWAGRQGPHGHQDIERIKLVTPPPNGKAETTTCTYDDGTVVDAVNRAPDGSQIVVNDDKQSARTRWTWVSTSGTWKIQDATTITTWHGEDRCAPQ
jgi:hypothetical protein